MEYMYTLNPKNLDVLGIQGISEGSVVQNGWTGQFNAVMAIIKTPHGYFK